MNENIILKFVQENNCTKPVEIAKALDIHPNTVRRTLQKNNINYRKPKYKPFNGERFRRLPKPFNTYAVSNFGTIIHIKSQQQKKTSINEKGYEVVDLETGTHRKKARVHRLVAICFIKKGNSDQIYVNHIDGNKLNNHENNLEWLTHEENMIHATRTGLCASFQKATPEQVHTICQILVKKKHGLKITLKQIGESFGLSKSLIEQISRRKNWKYISENYDF